MSNQCMDCQQLIDWNSKAREKLNTRRPLNPDGTIHSCNIGNRSSNSKPVPEPNDYPNPIIETSTPAAAKTITENNAGAKWVRSITSSSPPSQQQEDAALDALTLEFRTLLKHVMEYLKEQKK